MDNKIIFISGLFPKKEKQQIIQNSKGVIQFAADNLQWSILQGFIENNINPKVFNLPFIGSYPKRYKSCFIRRSNEEFGSTKIENLPFNNFTLYKFLSRYQNLRGRLSQENLFDQVIMIYSMNISFLKAAVDIKRKNNKVKICLIVPDLPEFMSDSENPIYRVLKSIEIYFLNKLLKDVDFFVLLTEQMSIKLNVPKNKYTVVEGIYNNLLVDYNYKKDSNKFVIMYSGTLAKRYGIMNLLSAFSMIIENNFELWICGDGDGKTEVIDFANQNRRIKYFGQINYENIIKMQKKADVLVNPRLPDDEFTQYSFPSKTMEYLASGTPSIAYKLEGIPSEYYPFIIFPEANDIESLHNSILKVYRMTEEERFSIGMNAKSFIFENKLPKSQTKKIIDLIFNHENKR